MSSVREAGPEDAPQLAGLLEEYLQETFQRPFRGTVEALSRDVMGRAARTLVAVVDAEGSVSNAHGTLDYRYRSVMFQGRPEVYTKVLYETGAVLLDDEVLITWP